MLVTLLASTLLAAQTPVTPAPSGDVKVTARKICKTDQRTESRLRAKRVCKTADEWRIEAEFARKDVEDLQRRADSISGYLSTNPVDSAPR